MGAARWTVLCSVLLLHQGFALYLEPDCGRVKNTLSQLPWMVEIRSAENGTFICAGTLINKRFVLTSASCIENQTDIFVRLGEFNETFNKNSNLSSRYEEKQVAMAFIHKLYSGNSSLHNVGLLRLDPDVVYKQNIQPICIEVTPEKEHKESSFKIRKIKPERSNWERFICFFRTFCYPCPSLVTNVPIESEGSPKSILTSSKVSLQTGILSWRNNQTNEIIYTDVMAYAGWILQIAMDVEIIPNIL